MFSTVNTSAYKNFDFSMDWRGSWGNYMYNNVDSNFGTDINVLLRQTDLSNGVANLWKLVLLNQMTFNCILIIMYKTLRLLS
jgi:hypothetical protein